MAEAVKMHHRDGPKLTAEHPPVLIKEDDAGILHTGAGVAYAGCRWELEADRAASYRPGAPVLTVLTGCPPG